jgi:hypothetical protein
MIPGRQARDLVEPDVVRPWAGKSVQRHRFLQASRHAMLYFCNGLRD